jgi:hypothetical protein
LLYYTVFQMDTKFLTMKKNLFLCVIVTLILESCAHEISKFSQGTWQLVSWKNMWGDTLVDEFPGDYTGSDLLIISGRHYLSVGSFTRYNSTVVNNYTGASQEVNGNHCEETLIYFPDRDRVGSKIKSILEIRNDTLVKTYPCNDKWEIIQSDYTIEKYVRMK